MSDRLALHEAVSLVDSFWAEPDGFLYLLRDGHYDPEGAGRLINALESITVSDSDCLPRRLVALTWYVPMYMEWQVDRVGELNGDVHRLRRDIDLVRNAVEAVLGTP
jgi:hypothetical protein